MRTQNDRVFFSMMLLGACLAGGSLAATKPLAAIAFVIFTGALAFGWTLCGEEE